MSKWKYGQRSFVALVIVIGLFLASILYLYQQHQISELTVELERLRDENGELHRMIKELEEELFRTKFAERLELDAYPTVCASDVDYRERGISLYENPNFRLAWNRFRNKTAMWGVRNLAKLIEFVGSEAEELGLNSTEITQILVNLTTSRRCKIWTVEDSDIIRIYSVVLVPCYVEKARYGGAEIWLIVFNRGDFFETLGHYDTYVIESGTQKILDHSGCM